MSRKQLFALLATIIGSGVVILDGTVVTLALPNIAHELHASFADLQWVVDGYALLLSALILLGGSLGDIFGRKRVYLIGLGGFGLASFLCGLAPNIGALIGLRALQGVFGALLVPGALAIINTNFPKDKRGAAIGRWSAWSALAAAIGPVLGGYIVDASSWRWIFFINVPLVIVCFALAQIGIEETKDSKSRSVDAIGAMLAISGLGGITYGLIEGPAHHWNMGALLPLIGGLVLFVLFILTERRRRDPMITLSLFGSRNFSGANLVTFAMYGALGGFLFALVIFLQTTVGYSAIKAGASLLPITALLLTLSGRFGGMAAKHGPRIFMTAGPLTAALGMALLYNLHHGSQYLTNVFPGIFLFALGLSLTVAPLTITVMGSVPDSSSGIASGINNAVSRVASLITVALLGILGASHVYTLAIGMCAGLAALAGIGSWILIRNEQTIHN
ncbi:MAG TPA: DHA2 family efflux MFS transporter permease subunit [Patescibacteria group bacterium]|nr:DHA2 family efflux MFS transporter permease subunit [Patescibacteria group bacterium]